MADTPNDGIFIGYWQPRFKNGKNLGKTFAVYAAPEDLTNASGERLAATYRDTVKEVASLRNWHGHDGGNFPNDAALYRALRYGTGIGKWFIPPIELLCGKSDPRQSLDPRDIPGNIVQPANLLVQKDRPEFKGTYAKFERVVLGDIATFFAQFYWASTMHRFYPRCRLDRLSAVSFSPQASGRNVDEIVAMDIWSGEDTMPASCRPVRVELVTPPALNA